MSLKKPELVPEKPPCRSIRKEKERLERLRLRLDRETAKDRLIKRHCEIRAKMAEGNGKKAARLRKARESAILRQLGQLAALDDFEDGD